MEDSIIIRLSLFRILFTLCCLIFSFIAVMHSILSHKASLFLICIVLICSLSIIYFLRILFYYRSSKIIFNQDGLIVYSILSNKPAYFIPRIYLSGIYFKDKLPSACNIILMPHQYSDKEYEKILKNTAVPEYIQNCTQNIPHVILGQIRIQLYLYKINYKYTKKMLEKYINT